MTVTGARGGVGATTIAANLAWHFGVEARRHTVLLDADLHRGTAAMLFGADRSPVCALRWRRRDRIDELFVERAASCQRAAAFLAAEESLAKPHLSRAAARLSGDASVAATISLSSTCPGAPADASRPADAGQRAVLVMEPTLARCATRCACWRCRTAEAARRAVLVLNREDLPGGLTGASWTKR